MVTLLVVTFILLAIAMITLILMHSGKDTGLSGAFGVSTGNSEFGGSTTVMERNLTRATTIVSILFVLNLIALLHWY